MPIIVNGTSYQGFTPCQVIEILEKARQKNWRFRLHYGDKDTGKAWGDIETGYIGRSMGPVKVPIILHNSRSTGGGAISTDCIVKIEESKRKVFLWEHPHFHL